MKKVNKIILVSVLFLFVTVQLVAAEKIFRVVKWELFEATEGFIVVYAVIAPVGADRYACNFHVTLLGKDRKILGESDATVYALRKIKNSQIMVKFYGVNFKDIESFDIQHVSSMKDGEF